jgi:hypothetical protein
MITTPMAIRQAMRAEIIPIGPYSFSSEMIMPEMNSEKTACMPTQNRPVATAHGNSRRQETRLAPR